LFVLLWSTGFIGAKYGLPYAEPFTFLGLRFALVSPLLLAVALLTKARWPCDWASAGHIVIAGLMVHGVYLAGVFSAIHYGVSAGLSALIVGMQPLLTAVLVGPFLGERLSLRHWLGLALGFGGVALVVSRQLSFTQTDYRGVSLAIMALLGITLGTLYQKRFCSHMDFRTGAVLQYVTVGIVMLLLAVASESRTVEWTADFVFALLWLSLVLSVGAVMLLYFLIRHGAAARVASLFYLVPPVTALVAYFVFGESLHPLALLGMAMAVVGVAIVHR
jgi:drug/metabolite transporter (DMT)-like permease